MRRMFFLIMILLSFNLSFSQDYMAGKKRYCETNDSKIIELYNLGFRCFEFKKYHNMSTRIFSDIIKKDSTLCDAYFWTAYSLRMQNKLELALPYYYAADSLSSNKSIEFKQNLAVTSVILGRIDLARKKYSEIVAFFPNSPEGYYGMALTSSMIGDYDKGLENIVISIEKYGNRNSQIKNQTEFLYGVLLTLNKRYGDALIHFAECSSEYKNDDNFNIHYSLCLLKIAEQSNDESLKKKGMKFYNKIKIKEEISESLKREFKM